MYFRVTLENMHTLFAKSLSYMGRVCGWAYFRVNLEILENTPTSSIRATYKLIAHWHIFKYYCTVQPWQQSHNGVVSDIGKLGARLELCQVDPCADRSV